MALDNSHHILQTHLFEFGDEVEGVVCDVSEKTIIENLEFSEIENNVYTKTSKSTQSNHEGREETLL